MHVEVAAPLEGLEADSAAALLSFSRRLQRGHRPAHRSHPLALRAGQLAQLPVVLERANLGMRYMYYTFYIRSLEKKTALTLTSNTTSLTALKAAAPTGEGEDSACEEEEEDGERRLPL